MTTTEINKIKKQIIEVLKVNARVSPSRSRKLLDIRDAVGKLYEAKVLATIIENLVKKEGLQISLVGTGDKLYLKQKGGPINRRFPYFQVWKKGKLFGEIFTDIYFNTLSSQMRLTGGTRHADYHELDIVLIEPNSHSMPLPEEIYLAVECKNTVFSKNLARELLGARRELSYLHQNQKTKFTNWPTSYTNAHPPSVHMLYTTSGMNLGEYADNCEVFGIILEHLRI